MYNNIIIYYTHALTLKTSISISFRIISSLSLSLHLSLPLPLSVSLPFSPTLAHPRRRGPYGSENIFSVLFLRALRSMVAPKPLVSNRLGPVRANPIFLYNIIILMPHALWWRARAYYESIYASIFSKYLLPSPPMGFRVYNVCVPLILYKSLYINR